MLEGEELEKAIKAVMKQIGIVNTKYIKKIAAQIKKIGELNPSSVNRLVAMIEMNNDIGEITEQLRQALGVSSRVIQKIYEKALQEVYTDPRFARYLEEEPDSVRPEARQKLTNYVQALWKQTAGNLYNYSNTTALRQTYIEAIDKAVLATSTGIGSYTETMRSTIKQLGSAGMQVVYASGYHRRIDTAVRQNIVDAVNQINKNASVMLADEINETAGEEVYDAIEISAHARSAPDHEPVQGHVFMKTEWEKLQAGLVSRDIDGRVFAGFRRPIGEWNCRHTPMSFSTKWSKRKWTDEQLRKFIDENRQGCEIDGKHKTLYEAMQMMRDIETAVRREKDTAVAAQAAGDDALRQQCQRNINALVRRYAEIAKASGNAEKRQRMTVEGFRRAKVQEKGLTPDRMAKTEEQLNSVKPIINTSESLQELRKYADSKGIQFYNPNAYDGDIDIMKRQIDAIASVREEYGITQKLTIQTVRASEDLGRTSNDGRTIYLNSSAYRDREETAEYMSKDGYFSTNVAEAIGVHEMGHIIHKKYGGIGLDIAREAWYNIHKEKVEYQEMLGILRKNVSIYSSTRSQSDEGKKFDPKQYREVIPEILAKNTYVPDEFTEEFIRLLKVRCEL